MRMLIFIDKLMYERNKSDLIDFLLRQPIDKHQKFIYGERQQEQINDLTLYETLLENLTKILYSDEEIVWTTNYGLQPKEGARLTEHLWKESYAERELVFPDDIKKVYMEQIL